MAPPGTFSLSCPLPLRDYPQVLLAHGGGGRLTDQLIREAFLPAFRNAILDAQHDGAQLEIEGVRLAFSTDSYVVQPLFFPGGDIGSLAVNGTVNDLAMCGARPLYLSAGFIVEEGLPMETLWRVAQSMGQAAAAAGVQLVTGDTKVVEHGKGDGLFINTTGIGVVHGPVVGPSQVQTGDAVLLSGDVGRHGVAVMAEREGLSFETRIQSDCAPLVEPVMALLEAGIHLRCLRDLTRGGLASALVEIAEKARVRVEVVEEQIPVLEEVQGACELLGLDPLYVANEGRFVAFVPAGRQANQALAILRSHPTCAGACCLGQVTAAGDGLVALQTRAGVSRVIERLSGEQLPRIC